MRFRRDGRNPLVEFRHDRIVIAQHVPTFIGLNRATSQAFGPAEWHEDAVAVKRFRGVATPAQRLSQRLSRVALAPTVHQPELLSQSPLDSQVRRACRTLLRFVPRTNRKIEISCDDQIARFAEPE